MDSRRVQCLLFSVVSWLAVLPRLGQTGTNIVTETYRLGTLRFWSGVDPYALPLLGGDRFEYSPFFCLLYTPFAYLPLPIQAATWALFNATVFWIGIFLWVRLRRESFGWRLIGFVIASMELNISLLYQQVNALLIGLSLIGVYLFAQNRRMAGGFLLAVATNLKTLPGIFSIPLLFSFDKRYWVGVCAGSAFTLLLPALPLGVSTDVLLHVRWLERMIDSLHLVRPDQLDIASILQSLGWTSGTGAPALAVLLISVACLSWVAFHGTPSFAWCALGSTALLLASPRTESPTFVLMAPAFIFAVQEALKTPVGIRRWGRLGIFLLAGMLTTVIFTDLWPDAWSNPLGVRYATKTLGALLIWGWALRVTLGEARAVGLRGGNLYHIHST